MKYFSKTNLKSKCRYRYHNDKSKNIAALRGETMHFIIAAWLQNDGKLSKDDIDSIFDRFGIPYIFRDEMVALFGQWILNKGDYILHRKEIVCVESSDAKDYRYGKKITKFPLTDEYGLHGIFDLVCIDKSSGIHEVIDWKTGSIPFDDHFENIINGTLAYLYYNANEIKSRIYSISMDVETLFVVDESNIDKCLNVICKKIEEIINIETEVINNDYPRMVNHYCGYCGLRAECSEYLKSLDAIPVFRDCDEFHKILDEITRLKDIRKACDSEINLLTQVRDDILTTKEQVVGDYIFSLEELPKFDYYTEDVYKALSELGYEEETIKILKFNKKDLDVLINTIRAKDGDNIYKIVKEVLESLKRDTGQKSTKVKKRLN